MFGTLTFVALSHFYLNEISMPALRKIITCVCGESDVGSASAVVLLLVGTTELKKRIKLVKLCCL
jgi:hypothetical protein